ncbi:MAG: polyhydroxyalkanoate synthesis regulator DNA-binding domain-containing protein [Deltaproteobacteria bacterium]|nr:polyhydroxyalkanoate synthesis regulator DNA-binding domain-containing protein [Deltaproteobacteria bacterium]
MPILIKRYANRKLYNTESSRYITLKGIAELLDQGEEVCVIDNETGEDITSVALSQILVDSRRTNREPPTSLLSQIMERGGDVLYDVLKKGVDDATDNLDEIQDRFRRIIQGQGGEGQGGEGQGGEGQAGEEQASKSERHGHARGERRRLGDWIAYASPDFDTAIQNAVERVFKILDLPRRKDVDALNQNLERVAHAVENLDRAVAKLAADDRDRDEAPDDY